MDFPFPVPPAGLGLAVPDKAIAGDNFDFTATPPSTGAVCTLQVPNEKFHLKLASTGCVALDKTKYNCTTTDAWAKALQIHVDSSANGKDFFKIRSPEIIRPLSINREKSMTFLPYSEPYWHSVPSLWDPGCPAACESRHAR